MMIWRSSCGSFKKLKIGVRETRLPMNGGELQKPRESIVLLVM